MFLGKGVYVVGLFGFLLCLVCVEMQRYCLSLDHNCVRDECFLTVSLYCLCTSSSLHLIKVTEQNLAFAPIP